MFVLRSDTPASVITSIPSGRRRRNRRWTESETKRSPQTNREQPTEVATNASSASEMAVNGSRATPGASALRAYPSRKAPVLPIFASAFAVRFGGAAAASECPKHIADTQALIDRVSANVECAKDQLPKEVGALVNDLIDEARMFLAAARQNHEMPQGPYDHARAFAKADVAMGYARAAEVLQTRGQLDRR